MADVYDPEPIKALLVDLFERAPKGTQARVAELAEVRPPTVNKWAKGQTCPDPESWPAIEGYFVELGMIDPGTFDAASSRRIDLSSSSRVNARLDQLEADVREISALLRQAIAEGKVGRRSSTRAGRGGTPQ